MPRRLDRRRLGFSLLELALALAIMAIMSAIALPRITGSYQRARLDSAARRVAADLNMVRARANTTSSPLAVCFTLATSQYQVPGLSDMDKPANVYNVRLGDAPYGASLRSITVAGVSQTSGTGQISFDGFGVPGAAASVTVAVGDATRVIVIDAGTGKAQVQ